MLTTSNIHRSLNCPIRLRLMKEGAPSSRDADEALRLHTEDECRFKALVRHAFPGETLCKIEDDSVLSTTKTLKKLEQLLKAGEGLVHEAVLSHRDLFAFIDMIRVCDGRIELFAIHAKTFDGPAEPQDPGELLTGDDLPMVDRDLVLRVGLKAIVAERALAASGVDVTRYQIVPCLLLANKNIACGEFEQYGQFKATRDSSGRSRNAEWVSSPEAGYRSPMIVSLDVSGRVTALRREDPSLDDVVNSAPDAWAKSELLDPLVERGTKCKACEFNCKRIGADDVIKDGLSTCWGDRADEARGLLNLYRAGSYQVVPGGPRWVHEFLAANPSPVEIGSLPQYEGLEPRPGDMIRNRQIRASETNVPNVSQQFTLSAYEMLPRNRDDGVVWFLDFETSQSCVSHFVGLHPYESFAFQFSLHRVPVSRGKVHWGEVKHKEWLFDSNTKSLTIEELDLQFLDALHYALHCSLDIDSDEKSHSPAWVVHWSGHELTTLQTIRSRLARRPPSDRVTKGIAVIDSLRLRLFDLLPIARDHVFHPRQKGSFSVKELITAVCSTRHYQARLCEVMGSMSAGEANGGERWDPYKALAKRSSIVVSPNSSVNVGDQVDGGVDAMSAFNRLRYGEDSATKPGLESQLKRYCKLDTASMVIIWEWMRTIGMVGSRLRELGHPCRHESSYRWPEGEGDAG